MKFFHSKKLKRGFSLIEMLVYIAILTIIFMVVVATLVSFTSTYRTLGVERALDHSAMGGLERVTRDIRNATSIDGTSALGVSPGTLSVVASRGGVSTTTTFRIQNGALIVEVNGVLLGPLTTQGVTVTNLIFRQLTSAHGEAVKVDVTLRAESGQVVKEKSYYTTVILKGS